LVALFVGFAAVGVTYGLTIVLGQNTLQKSEKLTDFSKVVEGSHLALVEAQRLEKTFGLTKDTIYLEQHAAKMIELSSAIKILGETAPDAQGTQVVDAVKKSLQAYRKALYNKNESLSILGLNAESGLLGSLNESASEMEQELVGTNHPGLVASLLQMRRYEKNYLLDGSDKHIDQVQSHKKTFKKLISRSSLPSRKKATINEAMKIYQLDFADIVAASRNQGKFSTILTDATNILEKEFDGLLRDSEKLIEQSDIESAAILKTMEIVFISVLVVTASIVAVVFVLLMRKITSSLGILIGTITKLSAGEYDARTGLKSADEFGQLGQSLDNMLDERLAGLAKAEKDNDQMNESIIEILEAVSTLSERDLTISVPIAEDITGAVSDSINQMAKQTAAVLNDIKATAEKVEAAAKVVKNQGDKVTGLADSERKVVESTIVSLDKAAQTMTGISSRAQVCNEMASKASQSTDLALEAVNNTVNGMAEIREIISETEKRIKRLGERSQEINGIVDIINTVAERTHVLALNASMQAAAAGEAGRGFAVVADEVQRLAEGSRSSTSQISELVNSIQGETAETMVTMNKLISQVVDGSELAEQAGKQMVDTQKTTSELVSAVGEISTQSISQAKVSNDIRVRAAQIQKSTEATGSQLKEQAIETNSLVSLADNMLESVRTFKLPAA